MRPLNWAVTSGRRESPEVLQLQRFPQRESAQLEDSLHSKALFGGPGEAEVPVLQAKSDLALRLRAPLHQGGRSERAMGSAVSA